ncbi:uncharacterized protein BDZ99DRAFT_528667 [Mytilinidion resinicola]|uniref:Uncharacterized protein n=1 Tax=Mytilinidion resinicola TaxID=574789 RepID=A0A6A6Z8Y3_9PEZI|nr:uncharacterized protein BDZ99DRAFT_528667 [Mytilinidion resinicola]KAF2816745.1 hypothetical protein BDZ99DRAFT_528667 [Mytilinidion resinicola]
MAWPGWWKPDWDAEEMGTWEEGLDEIENFDWSTEIDNIQWEIDKGTEGLRKEDTATLQSGIPPQAEGPDASNEAASPMLVDEPPDLASLRITAAHPVIAVRPPSAEPTRQDDDVMSDIVQTETVQEEKGVEDPGTATLPSNARPKYDKMTVAELRKVAKERGIVTTTRVLKATVIDMLVKGDAEGDDEASETATPSGSRYASVPSTPKSASKLKRAAPRTPKNRSSNKKNDRDYRPEGSASDASDGKPKKKKRKTGSVKKTTPRSNSAKKAAKGEGIAQYDGAGDLTAETEALPMVIAVQGTPDTVESEQDYDSDSDSGSGPNPAHGSDVPMTSVESPLDEAPTNADLPITTIENPTDHNPIHQAPTASAPRSLQPKQESPTPSFTPAPSAALAATTPGPNLHLFDWFHRTDSAAPRASSSSSSSAPPPAAPAEAPPDPASPTASSDSDEPLDLVDAGARPSTPALDTGRLAATGARSAAGPVLSAGPHRAAAGSKGVEKEEEEEEEEVVVVVEAPTPPKKKKNKKKNKGREPTRRSGRLSGTPAAEAAEALGGSKASSSDVQGLRRRSGRVGSSGV